MESGLSVGEVKLLVGSGLGSMWDALYAYHVTDNEDAVTLFMHLSIRCENDTQRERCMSWFEDWARREREVLK